MKIIRTANLIPLNKEKTKICLLRRDSQDSNNGKWAFPGESVKPGETDNQAIIRIIKDQMNCKVTNFKEFKKTENRVKVAVVKSQYLTGTLDDENIKLDRRKYNEYRWHNINEELLSLDFAFDEHKIVELFLKNFKK